jgi:hypothetical protein
LYKVRRTQSMSAVTRTKREYGGSRDQNGEMDKIDATVRYIALFYITLRSLNKQLEQFQLETLSTVRNLIRTYEIQSVRTVQTLEVKISL